MSSHIQLNIYGVLLANLTIYKETKNAATMKQWLKNITVSGGGDCPEYAMSGLVQGKT